MAEKKDLDLKDGTGVADVQVTTLQKQGFYDPSQETRMTRLGLSLESFKRAPGSTGGQIVHGGEHADPEHATDSPMLQQQMKTRHLVSCYIPVMRSSLALLLLIGPVFCFWMGVIEYDRSRWQYRYRPFYRFRIRSQNRWTSW
jgi:hypothetical protein